MKVAHGPGKNNLQKSRAVHTYIHTQKTTQFTAFTFELPMHAEHFRITCHAPTCSAWVWSAPMQRHRASKRRADRTRSSVCGHQSSTTPDGEQPGSEAVLDRGGTKSAGSFACIHGRHVCDTAVVERTGSKRAGRRDCHVSIWRRGAGPPPVSMPPC